MASAVTPPSTIYFTWRRHPVETAGREAEGTGEAVDSEAITVAVGEDALPGMQGIEVEMYVLQLVLPTNMHKVPPPRDVERHRQH